MLTDDKKKLILQCLVEGNSIRSTERIAGVHRDTITRLFISVSKTCRMFLDDYVENITSNCIQADEIWCFVKKKDKNLKVSEKKNKQIGSQYLFIAMCAKTKLVISFELGKRTLETTKIFINDLKHRLSGDIKVQLTTDGFSDYVDSVDQAFGSDIDYAQTIKHQGFYDKVTKKYIPCSQDVFIMQGKPDKGMISTSFVERQNLTIRMCLRRLTRLTNGFSKSFDNLQAALNLHFFYYNFMRIHQTLEVTPAMEAGIADSMWTWDKILNA